MNSVNIKGHLVRNAEIKYIGKNQVPCTSFTIALNKTFKNERGNIEKEASYFDVTFFGNYAQSIHESLVKGALVFVSGTLNQDRWQHDGKNYSRVSIIGKQISIIAPKDKTHNTNDIPADVAAPPVENYAPDTQTHIENTQEAESENIPI